MASIAVLLGIGALIWSSLRQKLQAKNLISPWDDALDFPECENHPPVLTSPILSGLSWYPESNPAQEFNWKRFWALFSSDRELTEEENAELLRLKDQLHATHRYLEESEKKKAEELQKAIQTRLAKLGINDDRSAYVVRREDYKRGLEKEREYMRLHRNFLFRTYDNRCSKCGDDSNGLDIDHFFFSKNEGGCFQMLHRDGFILNNAIPLCLTCNRSKSDKNYRSFFTQYELLRVLELNNKMNARLNQDQFLKKQKSIRGERYVDRESNQV